MFVGVFLYNLFLFNEADTSVRFFCVFLDTDGDGIPNNSISTDDVMALFIRMRLMLNARDRLRWYSDYLVSML